MNMVDPSLNSPDTPQRRHFESIDSTNRVALEWSEAPAFSVVSADSQTSGRGRLGRTWSSPAGKGLYFSVVNPTRDTALASLLSGLAVAQALEQFTSLTVSCKWPNDIICRGFKIGGILCESKNGLFVVGIGLNIDHEPEDLPARSVFPASSLRMLGVTCIDREELLAAILENMKGVFAQPGDAALRSYRAKIFGVGEVVKVGKHIGVLQGVDESGALQVRTSEGLRTVLTGDVSFFES